MIKIKKTSERSLFATITASIIGLGVLGVSLLILPINNVGEGFTFGLGILLAILSGMIAFEGKKSTIKNIIYSLSFWN